VDESIDLGFEEEEGGELLGMTDKAYGVTRGRGRFEIVRILVGPGDAHVWG